MQATPDEAVDARVRRRLRQLRAERGMKLQQVAERASIDVSTLSRLEAGKRRLALDHIPGLASALGVTGDDLLGTPEPQDPRVRGEPREFDGGCDSSWATRSSSSSRARPSSSRRGRRTGSARWTARSR